ncbi:MAG: hypothetical protein J0M04_14335 [Verrucomicrobia bacterium]|nr:hypothetical protein [Verrucomicrobiota bacterium]
MEINLHIEQVLPVLRPGRPAPGDPRACRPLFSGDDCEAVQVYYAVVGAHTNRYVTLELLHEAGIDIATLEQYAVDNWVRENQTLDWQDVSPDGNGRVMAARGSETMAGILLSKGHLKGMHRHFGSEMVYLVIPDIFTVLLAPDPIHVLPLGAGLYGDAVALSRESPECTPTEFLPCAFVSHNGCVSGTCALQPGEASTTCPTREEEDAQDPLGDSEIVVSTVMAAILTADERLPSESTMAKATQLLAEMARTRGLAGESARGIINKNGAPLSEAFRMSSGPEMAVVMLAFHLVSVRDYLGEGLYQDYASTLVDLAKSLSELERGLFGPKVSAKKKEALNWMESALFAREEEE